MDSGDFIRACLKHFMMLVLQIKLKLSEKAIRVMKNLHCEFPTWHYKVITWSNLKIHSFWPKCGSMLGSKKPSLCYLISSKNIRIWLWVWTAQQHDMIESRHYQETINLVFYWPKLQNGTPHHKTNSQDRRSFFQIFRKNVINHWKLFLFWQTGLKKTS